MTSTNVNRHMLNIMGHFASIFVWDTGIIATATAILVGKGGAWMLMPLSER